MDLKKVKEYISFMKKIKDDFEDAHSVEDMLYYDFIKWIAETGSPEQKKIAKEVLKTKIIQFSRVSA